MRQFLSIVHLSALLCPMLLAATSGDLPHREFPGVVFTENKGQVCDQDYRPRPDVLFGGSAGALTFHLRKSGISYQLTEIRARSYEFKDAAARTTPVAADTVPTVISIARVDVDWFGYNSGCKVRSENPLAGYENFYNQQCPDGIHHVRMFNGVTYENIYDGIDLHYYGQQGTLKYDFIVKPRGDHRQIKLRVNGAQRIVSESDGSITFVTPLGNISEGAPVVWQEGRRLPARWVLHGKILNLEIQGRDVNRLMIIDPAVRHWGTYYGVQSGWDIGYGCAVDSQGNVYMCGKAGYPSGNALATSGAHYTTFQGGVSDAFLVKFDPSGTRLWATFYGGAGDGAIQCIQGSTASHCAILACCLPSPAGTGILFLTGSSSDTPMNANLLIVGVRRKKERAGNNKQNRSSLCHSISACV